MSTRNVAIPHQLIVQLNSGLMQYRAPVLLAKVENVVDNDTGKALYDPTVSTVPMAGDTMTPELLAALNLQLAAIGYKLSKVE